MSWPIPLETLRVRVINLDTLTSWPIPLQSLRVSPYYFRAPHCPAQFH